MNRLTLHRRLALVGGVFLTLWILTGIVMAWPAGSRLRRSDEALPLDYRSMTVSPSQAVASLGRGSVETRRVSLHTVGERLAYEIRLADGQTRLVDAHSGQLLRITPRMAGELVQRAYPTAGSVRKIVRIDNHDLLYLTGEAPVYRVYFAAGRGTMAYVSLRSGAVTLSTRSTRLRAAMGLLHDFSAMRILLRDGKLPAILLILAGLLSLFVVSTGYYLAWRRLRFRWGTARTLRGG